MNGQAGQNLTKRYNMGGGEVMGTYWLGPKLGIAADYRLEAGTTPVFPNPSYKPRACISKHFRRRSAVPRAEKPLRRGEPSCARRGASHGTFDSAVVNYPGGSPISATGLGLYSNRTRRMGRCGRQCRLQLLREPRDPALAGYDLRALRYGNARVCFGISGRHVPLWQALEPTQTATRSTQGNCVLRVRLRVLCVRAFAFRSLRLRHPAGSLAKQDSHRPNSRASQQSIRSSKRSNSSCPLPGRSL